MAPLIFASQLLGRVLGTEWTVVQEISRLPSQTGGNFSIGYIVQDPKGAKAFCKALDFTGAMLSADPARKLQEITEAFNFERSILQKCKDRRMDRVVRVIDDGKITLDPINPMSVVQYLIFELAESDVRKFVKFSADLDLAWVLRSLHHTAVGLSQLHSVDIAHQDLKPSNVMVFDTGRVSKIGDLGRSSERGSNPLPHDHLNFAGDPTYAPIEALYGAIPTDWHQHRVGCDVYHLGSMAVFMFLGLGMTTMIEKHLDPSMRWRTWKGNYEDVLPNVREAFALAMDEFDAAVHPEFRSELGALVRQLCDPDPALRGDPQNRGTRMSPLSLVRAVSSLNILAARAEARMYRRVKP